MAKPFFKFLFNSNGNKDRQYMKHTKSKNILLHNTPQIKWVHIWIELMHVCTLWYSWNVMNSTWCTYWKHCHHNKVCTMSSNQLYYFEYKICRYLNPGFTDSVISGTYTVKLWSQNRAPAYNFLEVVCINIRCLLGSKSSKFVIHIPW
jgi:hypothetical protein